MRARRITAFTMSLIIASTVFVSTLAFCVSASQTLPTLLPSGKSILRTAEWFTDAQIDNGNETSTLNDGYYQVTAQNSQHWNKEFANTNAWRGASGVMFYVDAGSEASVNFFAEFLLKSSRGRKDGATGYVQLNSYKSGKESIAYRFDSGEWTASTSLSTNSKYFSFGGGSGWYYLPFSSVYYQGGSGSMHDDDVADGLNFTEFMERYEEQASLGKISLRSYTVGVKFGDICFVYEDKSDISTLSSAPLLGGTLSEISHAGNAATVISGNSITVSGMSNNSASSSASSVILGGTSQTSLHGAYGIRFHVDTTALGSSARLKLRIRLLNEAEVDLSEGVFAKDALGYASVQASESGQYVCRVGGAAYYYDAQNEAVPLLSVGGNADTEGDIFAALPQGYNGYVYIPMDSFGYSVTSYTSSILLPWQYAAERCSVAQIELCGAYDGTVTSDSAVYSDFQVLYGDVSGCRTDYDWSSDFSTCTATHTCSVWQKTITETVNTVKTVTQTAICKNPELSTFTATFEHKTVFDTQTRENVQSSAALHSYNDGNGDGMCDTCGYVEALNAVVGFSYASVAIDSSYSLCFYVNKSMLDDVTSFNITLSGCGVTKTYETKDSAIDGLYRFVFDDINPAQIGDTVTANISVVYDGRAYVGNALEYSVKQYCTNMLEKYDANPEAMNDSDIAFRKVVVSMLNYGAEVQKYLGGYTEGQLVNANLSSADKVIDDATCESDFNISTTVAAPTVTWHSASVLLGNTVNLRLKIAVSGGVLEDGTQAELEIAGTPITVNYGDFVQAGQGIYYFDVENMSLLELDSIITAKITQNGVAVSNTLTYSIETYAYRLKSGGTSVELVNSMMNFGRAVLAYDADWLVIADNLLTEYKVVQSAQGEFADEISSFVTEFSALTGATLATVNDSASESEYEILIGEVDREESRLLYEELPYTGAMVKVYGKKIVVGAYDSEMLGKGLNKIILAAVEKNEGSFYISEHLDYLINALGVDIPKLETDGDFNGLRYCTNSQVIAGFENVSTSEYNTYCTKLADEGYSVHMTNTVEGNVFTTYSKGDVQVHVSRYPTDKTLTIVFGKGDITPNTVAAGDAVTEPYITQLARNGATQEAPGMLYVIGLPDGRYIIVDGGPSDSDDEAALLQYLKDNNPNGGKPVIAAWFITHADSDHINLPISFLTRYKDEVVVEMAAYSMPDFSKLEIVRNSGAEIAMNSAVINFQAAVKANNPSAKLVNFHTGQKFMLGAAQIEIIYTHEDYYPNDFPYGNQTSSAFRVTLGSKTIMFLGDCEVELCEFMTEKYGSFLKSDILQVSHHGFNGATKGIYQAIAPDMCLWSVDEYRFNNDTRCLGTLSGYEFNKWLRDNVSSEYHYHNSVTTKISLN